MRAQYTPLTGSERNRIYTLLQANHSHRMIAKHLRRNPSTLPHRIAVIIRDVQQRVIFQDQRPGAKRSWPFSYFTGSMQPGTRSTTTLPSYRAVHVCGERSVKKLNISEVPQD